MMKIVLRDALIGIGIASLVVALVNSAMAAENLALRAPTDYATVVTLFAFSWNPSFEPLMTAQAELTPHPWAAFRSWKQTEDGSAPLVQFVSLDTDVFWPVSPSTPRATRGAPREGTRSTLGTSRETPWDDWESRERSWSDDGEGDSPWD